MSENSKIIGLWVGVANLELRTVHLVTLTLSPNLPSIRRISPDWKWSWTLCSIFQYWFISSGVGPSGACVGSSSMSGCNVEFITIHTGTFRRSEIVRISPSMWYFLSRHIMSRASSVVMLEIGVSNVIDASVYPCLQSLRSDCASHCMMLSVNSRCFVSESRGSSSSSSMVITVSILSTSSTCGWSSVSSSFNCTWFLFLLFTVGVMMTPKPGSAWCPPFLAAR